VRYQALGGSSDLARLRIAKSYEGRNAGQIAKDLAGEAGVATGRIADGLDFPYLVLDGRRSAWDHLADLALRSGFLATVSAEGKLDFGPPDTEPAATFTYAVDLLGLEMREGAPPFAALALSGDGAAGSQGQSAWGWLLKDPAAVQAEAGSGTPARALSDAALKSTAAVRSAAANRLAASGRAAVRGRLLVPGSPDLRPGQLVEVAAAPTPLSARYLVLGVRHRFSKREGFTTRLDVASAAAGGAGGPLGGALGAVGGLL
jgi:phage protein D